MKAINMDVITALNKLTVLYCTRKLKVTGPPIVSNPTQSSIRDYHHQVANNWNVMDLVEIFENYESVDLEFVTHELERLLIDYPTWLLDPGFYITIEDIRKVTKSYNVTLAFFRKYVVIMMDDYFRDYDEQIFNELFNTKSAFIAKKMLNNWAHAYD